MSVVPFPNADVLADRDVVRVAVAAAVQRAVAQALGPLEGRATCSPEELAVVLGVSRGSGYELCRQGRVPTIRVGRSVRVLVPALVALLLGGDP